MLTIFGAVAELEREYILQRQREGIAIAGLTEDDFGSLSEEYIQKFNEFFKSPEIFINLGDGLLIIVLE